MNGKTFANFPRDSRNFLGFRLTGRYEEKADFCGGSRTVPAKPHRYPSDTYGLTGKLLSPARLASDEALTTAGVSCNG